MRIAQVAPLAESVPPKFYGGTERVVAWLTEELIALGHDVTLFASGDSKTRASLVPLIPRAIRLSKPRPDPFPAYAALLDALANAAQNFDIIHCHTDWLHLPLLTVLNIPHLTTFHNRLDTPDLPAVIARFPDAPLVSISDHHRKPLPSANWLGTVYHGMPARTFTPSYEPGSYLAFVGRFTKEKGPETAIALARQSGMPLRMAAKIPRSETRYYKDKLEPLIDGDRIRLVGELNDADKGCLLRNAAALLFPIDWPEPFGLVMIEALACGTPVIAFRRGAVPEVIDDRVTGFVVNDYVEALAAIRRLNELDRRRIRSIFDERFTSRRMARDYLGHYEKLLRDETRRTLKSVRRLRRSAASSRNVGGLQHRGGGDKRGG